MRTDWAHGNYKDFAKEQHAFRPDDKSVFSKKIRKTLGPCVRDTRQKEGNYRIRCFKFASLAACRQRFATYVGAPTIQWEPESDATDATQDVKEVTGSIAPLDAPEIGWEPDDTEPDDNEWEPVED